MLYDLHMHSCLSPCAEDDMTPANIAGLAKLAGAELIAVTDHNAADNLPAVQCCCNAYGLRLLPGVGRLQTDNAVLFWSDEHAGALCDVRPEQYGLVSKIQSAGAVRLSARIAVRGCRYGGGCGSAGCQKETGKAVEPPCPRYPGMKKPQRQQALRLHVLLCSQCNLRFWKHLGYTPRFKTAWVLVPFPYFRNTGFCISYF